MSPAPLELEGARVGLILPPLPVDSLLAEAVEGLIATASWRLCILDSLAGAHGSSVGSGGCSEIDVIFSSMSAAVSAGSGYPAKCTK